MDFQLGKLGKLAQTDCSVTVNEKDIKLYFLHLIRKNILIRDFHSHQWQKQHDLLYFASYLQHLPTHCCLCPTAKYLQNVKICHFLHLIPQSCCTWVRLETCWGRSSSTKQIYCVIKVGSSYICLCSGQWSSEDPGWRSKIKNFNRVKMTVVWRVPSTRYHQSHISWQEDG